MPRSLRPGQRCRILLVDARTGSRTVVYDDSSTLVEAPNWSPDGGSLVVNADGLLWRLPLSDEGRAEAATAADLHPIEMLDVPEINNDHVIAPDGASIFVSGRDGHLYRIPAAGGRGVRVTRDHPAGRSYKNYLHGISPDGTQLAVIVGARPTPESGPETWRTDVALVAVADGTTRLLTDDAFADDGAEFSADGEWLWFNSERFTTSPGHAQIARIRVDGSDLRRVVVSETVDWFPHPSPDGSLLLHLAYESGTLGHPADHRVVLRTYELDAGTASGVVGARDLVELFGGQGTTNVPGWAPDSRRFACVEYPFDDAAASPGAADQE